MVDGQGFSMWVSFRRQATLAFFFGRAFSVHKFCTWCVRIPSHDTKCRSSQLHLVYAHSNLSLCSGCNEMFIARSKCRVKCRECSVTQGQIDGFFGHLPYKCHQHRVASVGD